MSYGIFLLDLRRTTSFLNVSAPLPFLGFTLILEVMLSYTCKSFLNTMRHENMSCQIFCKLIVFICK